MPAKKNNSTESPQKTLVDEDLISLDWCVTDRKGLYVHQYTGEEGDANDRDDTLTRVGAVRQVALSGVYSIDGQNTSVFKMQVHIAEYNDGTTQSEEQLKWYVLREDKFVDFSDEVWRDDNLNENETAATNVDPDLLDAAVHTMGRKGNNGKWFKNWVNANSDDTTASATAPNRSKPLTIPSVFGAPGVQAAAVEQSSSATATKPMKKVPPPGKAPLTQQTNKKKTNRGKHCHCA